MSLETEGLRRLLDVSRRINAEVNPDAVLAAIVDSLVSLTRADRGFLMIKGPDGELEFAIARDKQGEALPAQKFSISEGVVQEVAASGETRLIDDAASTDAWQARVSVIRLSLRTILCTPLRSPQGVIGVIYVDSSSITRRFTEADVPLVEAFAAQAAAAVDRVRLQRAERERDRMRSQLRVASDIQRTFLLDAFPDLPGVQGAVASVPALEVGGDFYDVMRLPGGRVGLMVGDVSGKGVPGALFGARLMSDVRYEMLYQDDVGLALTAINRIVADRATRGMFVTFLYVVLDPKTGEAEFSNAGHQIPPLVRNARGELHAWDGALGLPLGVAVDATYQPGHERLEPGDTLLLITDGITDAVGPGGERFGDERAFDVIRRAPGDPDGLLEALQDAVRSFTGRRRQADDQTLVAVARR